MIAARQTAEAARRRAEDLGIAVDIIMRSVPPIDDLIRALGGAGGSARLVGALRAELACRRGGRRR
jgi:predicted RecB family endonuclease